MNELKAFYGTKKINAKLMNRQEYNDLRGGHLPADENPADEGYLIEYVDGGKPNTEAYDGYVSWSPKDVFEKAYNSSGNLTFGQAIEAAKEGKKIARSGWNGKNMFIVLMPGLELPSYNTQGTERKVNDRTARFIGKDTPLKALPYFAMFTATKDWLPGWLASQTDMLAEDWGIVD